MLYISVGTVRKHMEHIFDRTGVRSRSAAAAAALPSPLRFNSGRSFVSGRRQEVLT
jgi:hypothetical protein